jgi:uncharacterized membrane protein
MIISYFLTLIAFLVIDLVWLGLVAKKFYWSKIGNLLTTDYVWSAIIAFYLIYIAGIFYFVVYPSIANNSALSDVFIRGAFLGILCYATYDLVNMGTLKQWSWSIVVVDILWGAALTGTVSCIGYVLMQKFG